MYLLILVDSDIRVGLQNGGVLVTVFDITLLVPLFFHRNSLIPQCRRIESCFCETTEGSLILEKLNLLNLVFLNETPSIDEYTSILSTLLNVQLVVSFHERCSLGHVVVIEDSCGPGDENRLVCVRVIINIGRGRLSYFRIKLSIRNTHEKSERNRSDLKHLYYFL